VQTLQGMRKATTHILLLILAMGCTEKNQLPHEKYYEFHFTANYSYQNDTLKIEVKNPLNCPLRFSISSTDTSLSELVKSFGTLTVHEKTDTIIKYYFKGRKGILLQFHSLFGDLSKQVIKNRISLPFPKNRSYKIIQGYNGLYSHNNANSKCAIDFALNLNDTICSADSGYVVGVIKDYKKGGDTEAWIDYANCITIYHPKTGLFTQYVHLMHNGSFVKVGDTVVKGQPIGLSGMTGYGTVPHLHFNVKIPDKKEGMISTDIEFEEGYKGTELTENTTVKK
jgi:murein DD-endopeptidase MepM/ murein hydrolase activator NlpD